MPRWRALPEELDPQIREFASQLRRLVDRSDLSVAAIADRTGYSKSSWERYLNGRLLPPRGATQALAEVTGTDVRHLGIMWELAERAWSRSEMRHDVTLEAIQVAQARAALGEFGDEPEKGRRRRKGKDGSAAAGGARSASSSSGAASASSSASPSASASAPAGPVAPEGPVAPPSPASPASPASGRGASGPDDRTRALPVDGGPASGDQVSGDRASGGPASGGPDEGTAVLRKGAIRAAGGVAGTRERGASGTPGRPSGYASPQPRVDVTSWGAAASTRPASSASPVSPSAPTSPTPSPAAGSGGRGRPGAGAGDDGGPATTVRPPVAPGGGTHEAQDTPAATGSGGHGTAETGQDGGTGGQGGPESGAGRRRVTMLLAGVVGALVVTAAAVLFLDLGSGSDDAAGPKPSATKKSANLPSGVKCSGKDCSGKDPEAMGCGGQYAKTSSSAWVGASFVEVRYSKVCEAAWARITSATTDDALRIVGPGDQEESDKVGTTNDAYTEMVSVGSADGARACARLVAGGQGCTVPGRTAR